MVLPTGGGKMMGTDGNLRLLERMQAHGDRRHAGLRLPPAAHRLASAAATWPSVRRVVLGAEKVPRGLKAKMHGAPAGLRRGRASRSWAPTASPRRAWPSASARPAPRSRPATTCTRTWASSRWSIRRAASRSAEGADGELVYTGISGHGTVVCRYRTGDLVIGGMTWEPCPWCGRTLPRIASSLRRVSEQHALNLTKIKGTLVDLSHMGTLLSEMRGVEEWQVVISKKNDDPLELDQLEVRVAPRADARLEDLEQAIARELLQATEVAPNKISFHSLGEMLEFLGMETEIKEKPLPRPPAEVNATPMPAGRPQIVIAAGVRTPQAKAGGAFRREDAGHLGAFAVRELLARAGRRPARGRRGHRRLRRRAPGPGQRRPRDRAARRRAALGPGRAPSRATARAAWRP